MNKSWVLQVDGGIASFFLKQTSTTQGKDEITLLEIFNFCPKIQLWFPEKIGWKTRENVVVLDFLAVDNFDFTRKNVKKFLDEKLVKMLCVWLFE